MGRIKGYYEWDDDDLTPGQKSEGGLHQNLFDEEGKLRGNARFVPDDGDDSDPLFVTEDVYIPADQRRQPHEENELAQAIGALLGAGISAGIDYGIAKAKPHVEHWWRETARPGIDAQRAKWSHRRPLRRRKKETPPGDEALSDRSQELAETTPEIRPQMSRAEAQARYLASLAARAYSDEQMRLVNSAHIVDGEELADVKRSLAQLPQNQVKSLVEAMTTDPSLLTEATLAELASLLGQHNRSGSEEQLHLD